MYEKEVEKATKEMGNSAPYQYFTLIYDSYSDHKKEKGLLGLLNKAQSIKWPREDSKLAVHANAASEQESLAYAIVLLAGVATDKDKTLTVLNNLSLNESMCNELCKIYILWSETVNGAGQVLCEYLTALCKNNNLKETIVHLIDTNARGWHGSTDDMKKAWISANPSKPKPKLWEVIYECIPTSFKADYADPYECVKAFEIAHPELYREMYNNA